MNAACSNRVSFSHVLPWFTSYQHFYMKGAPRPKAVMPMPTSESAIETRVAKVINYAKLTGLWRIPCDFWDFWAKPPTLLPIEYSQEHAREVDYV